MYGFCFIRRREANRALDGNVSTDVTLLKTSLFVSRGTLQGPLETINNVSASPPKRRTSRFAYREETSQSQQYVEISDMMCHPVLPVSCKQSHRRTALSPHLS